MNNATTGALGGIYLFVVLFLALLAILWFFLPFAIFGTKAKLDSLIHEMKLMNIALGKVREHLSLMPQRDETEVSGAQGPSEIKLTHDQIMAKYKISNDGQKYIFKGHRYDRLEDAVAYAISQAR